MTKTGSVAKSMHLNLYNFENSSAKGSSYVLTSPRSLEACRKAGCKPVELLHKNIEEYQDVLGDMDLADMHQLYQNEEKRRLDKLAICQAIRRKLNTNNLEMMKENILSSDMRSPEVSSYEHLCDKENLNVAFVKQINNNISLKSQPNSEKSDNCSDSDLSIYETSVHSTSPKSWSKMQYETSDQKESVSTHSSKKKFSPLSRSSFADYLKHASSLSYLNRKMSPNPKRSPVPTCSSSGHHSASSNSLAASSLTSTGLKTTKKLQFCTRPSRALSGNKSVPSSACTRRNKCSSLLSLSDSSRKENSPDCSLSEFYELNDNSNNKDSVTRTAFPLRKHVSFGCSLPILSCDDLSLSEHDRRILASMALKKELQQESDEFAHNAHILWEQDHQIREHMKYEHARKWKEYVAEKRRIEIAENTQKLEEIKQSFQKSKDLLKQRIHEKEELVTRRKKYIDDKKMIAAEERCLVAAKRRADVESAQQLMNIETALWQHAVNEQQRERLERAENIRLQCKENYQRRVASTNRVEELLHQECWLQAKEETEAALQKLHQLCHQREQRAHEHYQQLLLDRDHHIKSQSLERAIKFRHVRDLQDELEQGLKVWQEQVMQLQWASMQRAEQNVMRNMEGKRQRVEMENRTRRQHHSKLMERISREDEVRIRFIRDLIKQKESKMKRMALERDLAIRESRLQARTAADLREYLRCTLFPETFDKKVARVVLEMRVAGRPPAASPRMTKSHIFLG